MKKLVFFFVFLFILILTACENPLFVEASNLYTVSFETNGGTRIESYRTDKIQMSPKTQKEGEDFLGWYTSESYEKQVSFPLVLSKNTILYAKWEQHKDPYYVSFVSNGGTEVVSFYGKVIQKKPYTSRNGYSFNGWYLDPEFRNPIAFPFSPDRNCILYAKWIERSDTSYKVQHYKQDTNLITYSLYEFEEKTGTTGTETQAESKDYIGFHQKEFEQESIKADGTTEIEIYYDRDSFTVFFDANDGSGKKASQIFYYDVSQQLNPNSFSRKNYFFNGWGKTQRETTVNYIDGANVIFDSPHAPNSSITLYARWIYGTAVTNQTVSNLNLTNLIQSFIVKVNGTINQNTLIKLAKKIEQANMYITLDLSEATGLSTISVDRETGYSVFSKCKNLEKLILPDTLTTIGAGAFKYCHFNSVEIPDSVTSIGTEAFIGCGNMTNIKIGNSVQSIGEWAFGLCNGLSDIILPKSLMNIAPCAFYGLEGLLSVTFNDSNAKWTCRHVSLADLGYTSTVNVNNKGLNAVRLKDKYANYFWIKN